MRQLTPEEVVAFAKVCGLREVRPKGHVVGWLSPNGDQHDMSDPHFWLGELWDRLCEILKPTRTWSWSLDCEKSLDGKDVTFLVYIEETDCHYPCPDSGGYEHPCIALYKAIKAKE